MSEGGRRSEALHSPAEKRRRQITEADKIPKEHHSKVARRPVADQSEREYFTMDAMVRLASEIYTKPKPLPTFDGDILEWPPFIDEYRRTTTHQNLSQSVNRQRLEIALKGPAKAYVRDKLKSTCFVDDVIYDLQQKYGNRENIVRAVLERLNNTTRLEPDLQNIREFTLQIQKMQWMINSCHLEGLELILLIKSLGMTPNLIRLKWGDYQREIMKPNSGKFDDFVNLLQRIQLECDLYEDHTRERDYTLPIDEHCGRSADNHQTSRRSITHSKEWACEIGCHSNHPFIECPKFIAAAHPQRYALLVTYKRCMCCGEPHNVKYCPDKP